MKSPGRRRARGPRCVRRVAIDLGLAVERRGHPGRSRATAGPSRPAYEIVGCGRQPRRRDALGGPTPVALGRLGRGPGRRWLRAEPRRSVRVRGAAAGRGGWRGGRCSSSSGIGWRRGSGSGGIGWRRGGSSGSSNGTSSSSGTNSSGGGSSSGGIGWRRGSGSGGVGRTLETRRTGGIASRRILWSSRPCGAGRRATTTIGRRQCRETTAGRRPLAADRGPRDTPWESTRRSRR